MAFTIKYARLFEIRILHGFYLDKGGEKNFFELDSAVPNEKKFKDALLRRYDLLRNDLTIEPTPACEALMKGHSMVFRTLPTGFMVGIKVTEQPLGGITGFAPVVPVAPGTVFQFKIKTKNAQWSNFSSFRMRPNVPAAFHFTNFTATDQIVPPSLALTPGVRTARYYEMGERVRDPGTNQLYEAVRGVPGGVAFASTAHWNEINDFRYAGDGDQQLLPRRFRYRFTPDDGADITQATFVLSSSDEPNVATVETEGNGPFTEYPLDFRSLDVPPGAYTLTVNAGAGYEDIKEVVLDDDSYEGGLLALVSIGHEEGLPVGLRLLEDDGTLRRVGDETRHPEFEIRVKARQTYWRYFLHPEQVNLNTPPAVGSDVVGDADNDRLLVAKRPRPLTATGSKISYDPNVLLPSPSNLLVMTDREDDERKYFSDTYLEQM